METYWNATKKSIDQAIEKLDFRVNTLARALRTNRTMTVGVIIPEFFGLFFTTVAAGIESALSRHGYGILLCDSHSTLRGERDAVEFLVNKQVDGIIAVTSFNDMTTFSSARKRNVPVVLIDNVPPNRIFDVVTTDNLNASREATSYLLSMGHVKCGVICGQNEIYTARERLAGYLDAFRRIGLEPDMGLVEVSEYSLNGGYEGFIAAVRAPSGHDGGVCHQLRPHNRCDHGGSEAARVHSGTAVLCGL